MQLVGSREQSVDEEGQSRVEVRSSEMMMALWLISKREEEETCEMTRKCQQGFCQLGTYLLHEQISMRSLHQVLTQSVLLGEEDSPL